MRLDRVLAARIEGLSRTRLKALILEGAVTIGGRTIRGGSSTPFPAGSGGEQLHAISDDDEFGAFLAFFGLPGIEF